MAYTRILFAASAAVCASFAAAAAVPCGNLTSLSLPHTSVTSAVRVAASGGVPTYCLVEAHARPTSDSDIKILVGLPTASNWNGKYLQSGNGGFAGSVAPPTGSVQLGYAGAATDDGHTASGFDASWALGHPEKVVDFGYRALKETTNTAKAIIAAYYGASPRLSYFSGCSDGGREALQEAQRFASDWDGIIVGAPANFWTHHFTGFVFNQQVLANTPIPPAKLPAIQAAALAQCDGSDGVLDGVVENPGSCRFDPGRMLCAGADNNGCLTQAQVTAVRAIMNGPHDPRTGELIFPGYVFNAVDDPNFLGLGAWIFNGAPAPLFFSGTDQINFQVPMSAPQSGTANLQVIETSSGRLLGDTTVSMLDAAPGIFTQAADGKGAAIAVNEDNTLNTQTNPAIAGHFITLYGTGQGVVDGAPPDGDVSNSALPSSRPPTVIISPSVKEPIITGPDVQYAGLAPGLVGVWQVNVKIPPDVVTLPSNPVQVIILQNSHPSGGGALGRPVLIYVKQPT